jgi:16S rRNA (uracil1498-N3)-methyltransferase
LSQLTAGEVRLPEESAIYVTRVRRVGVGERFVAFDPEVGLEAEATVLSVSKGEVRCRLDEPRQSVALPLQHVTLIQALGKGDKPDRVIRDATALGASRILLTQTDRTVPKPGDRAESRRERYRRIAIDAARQCGRGNVPDIEGPVDLAKALADERLSVARYGLDPEASVSLFTLLARTSPSTLALVVGPEGGFTDAERQATLDAGFTPARLGMFVLRTETAATAALAVVAASW